MEESEYGLKITRLEDHKPRPRRTITNQEIENKRKLYSNILGKNYINAYLKLLKGA